MAATTAARAVQVARYRCPGSCLEPCGNGRPTVTRKRNTPRRRRLKTKVTQPTTKKIVREVKTLRTVDRQKTSEHCRCCRCCGR